MKREIQGRVYKYLICTVGVHYVCHDTGRHVSYGSLFQLTLKVNRQYQYFTTLSQQMLIAVNVYTTYLRQPSVVHIFMLNRHTDMQTDHAIHVAVGCILCHAL